MEVTRGQLVSGATRFAKNEVIAKIPDKSFKMVMSMLIDLLELKPEIADDFLKPMANERGMYDIDLLERIATRTLDEYGDFPIVIPAIKFISPTEKELRFSSDDIRKLREYIGG
jgi:hypothetical protein